MSTKTGRTGMEIAVIGMAGRFPGAKNIAQFWENLKDGKESITFFTDEELLAAGTPPLLLQNPNYVKANGILDGFDCFDAAFFGYIPAEAAIMAPQVRLFHECVWEGLEHAGYNPETYTGRIGLYAGATSSSRWEAMAYLSALRSDAKEEKDEPNFFSFAETFTNSQLTDKDNLTTRISYKFNLTGPSFLIQTACSTSLVAVHVASQGLINGECEIAAAGGTAVNITRRTGYLYHEGGILSPDGHNRAFDALGKGTVAGDGSGVVILKLLEDAEADGDYIHAVIKGSAINNDGFRKVGYTAPSVEGQAQVIGTAQYIAEVEPGSITYVETHGTATELGDPVEVAALKLAFGNTARKKFCALGSVKSNIGHLNAAAGIAGFIKTVLVLKYGLIPPSLHYQVPNPKIDFENSPFYVNTQLHEWLCDGYPRRAGVSSFGIGGTNAHVVLEEYYMPPIKAACEWEEKKYELILLSARSEQALEKVTGNLYLAFKTNPGISLPDAAYTQQVGRKHFTHRRTAVCCNNAEVLDFLAPGNGFKTRTHTVATPLGKKPPVAFLFPGQGSQYIAMGLDLYRKEPLFHQKMDRCFEILTPLMGYDVKQVLYPPGEDYTSDCSHGTDIINQTEIAQPLIFAFEYALASLLMSWGIEPGAMIGHSIGEYTAACLAGVFTLEDALTLVVFRGRLMQQMPGGAMLSVAMSEEQLNPLLTKEICLAAVNGPSRCVVSGPVEAVNAFEAEIKAKGIDSTRLHISHAFHSSMMDPILEPFKKRVEVTPLHKPVRPYISNLYGRWITAGEAMDPDYWTQHLRRAVRFSQGIQLLSAKDDFVFIEVGPGHSLTTLVKQNNGATAAVNLVRHSKKIVPDDRYLLDKIGQLWLYDISIDWALFHKGKKRYRLPLPTYPFEQRRYWIDDIPAQFYPQFFQAGGERATGEEENENTISSSAQEPRPMLNTPYIAPGDAMEKILATIWENFFGISGIGIYDDFFELGGDSLKAMNVIGHIHKETGVIVPPGTFFETPNIHALAGYIRNKTGKDFYAPIENIEEKEFYELSRAQKRVYIQQQEDSTSTAYNLPAFYILEGQFDIKKSEAAFVELIKRHESLRTSFKMMAMSPVQRIRNKEEVEFKMETYGSEMAHPSSSIIHHFIRAFIRPFDLSKAPLLRVGLLEMEKGKYLLMIDIHHIISDGISMTILMSEFKALYKGESLPGLRLQYKDYSQWQNERLSSGEIKRQEAYWSNEFAGAIPKLRLPVDYKRGQQRRFEGSAITFSLDREWEEKLRDIVKEEEITIFIFLLAIYNIFLFKISGQEDIIIGTVAAGRGHANLESIIGMFVNTLALRNFPRPGICFAEFLANVKKRTLAAFENQDYQFEDLVDRLNSTRDAGRNPLFDVLFSFISLGMLQGAGESQLEEQGLKISEYKIEESSSMFDLVLGVFDWGEKLGFVMQYNLQLFKKETVERFTGYFKDIITAVLANKNIPLGDIAVTSALQAAPSNVYKETEMDFEF